MKYFDTEKMKEIRGELDKEILKWPGLSSMEMMGCLCYLHGKSMIAFLVTGGIVISELSEQDQSDLSKLSKKMTFKIGGKTIRKHVWEMKNRDDIKTILPFINKSYQAVKRIKK